MTRIEHLAMYVEYLEKARDFFVNYFGAACNDGYHNPKTDFRSYFISFEGGTRLELMNKPTIEINHRKREVTGYIHVALSVGSRKKVDELTARLRTDGYEIVSGPRITGDGYYESCVEGFEGNLIEITE